MKVGDLVKVQRHVIPSLGIVAGIVPAPVAEKTVVIVQWIDIGPGRIRYRPHELELVSESR